MDIQDLKNDWNKQHFQDSLVVKLFRESRESKVKGILRKMTFFTVLWMLFTLFAIVYTWLVLVEQYLNMSVLVTGALVLVLSYIVFFKNVLQLDRISKINSTKPVVELYTLINLLKVQRIRHNRFIFIFSVIYCWSFAILFFGLDLTVLIPVVLENAPIVIYIHISFIVAWFPLSLWILKKYDDAKHGGFWERLRKNSFLLDDSVNTSLNEAIDYLNEIREFEKEEK